MQAATKFRVKLLLLHRNRLLLILMYGQGDFVLRDAPHGDWPVHPKISQIRCKCVT